MPANILLLEDDKLLNKGITIALEKDRHRVVSARSYFEAVENFTTGTFDLYLLDINLPDGNGMMFCKKIRGTTDSPIIFITANDTETDMLDGFEAGCDDYIAKPFSIEVLRKKVLVLLNRMTGSGAKVNLFQYKDLEVNFDRMTVSKKGSEIMLTAKEFRLLEYLISNKGKVLTRSMILAQVWDIDGDYIDENTLSVYIRRLRSKIEESAKNPQYIITVFGIGYTFGE